MEPHLPVTWPEMPSKLYALPSRSPKEELCMSTVTNSNKQAPTPPQPQRLPSLPAPPDAQFNAAKRLYAEQWGDAVVTNTYLKITIAALALLCAGSLWIAWATVRKIETFHTRYVRIDSIGRAEAITYDDL